MIPEPVTEVFPNVEYIRTEIIGLPIGRDRQVELERSERSFGAYQGPLGNIRHKDVFAGDPKLGIESGIMWVDPANDARNNLRQPHPDLTNASEFTFTSSTHLGTLLADPRGFDPSFAVGFHTTTDFDDDDEAACLAAGTEDRCGTPGICRQQVTAAAGAASETRAFDGLIVRELVPDFDFRLVGGITENARILDGPGMPDLKALIPDEVGGPLRDFLTETAATGWVEAGTWRRSGAVTLGGDYASMVDNVQPFIGASSTATALEAELETLSDQDMTDRVAAFSSAAAHLTTSKDSWVDIVGSGAVSTTLFPASLVAEKLLVRVEYDLGSSASAKIKVGLKGPGVSTSASWTTTAGTSRQVAELVVSRNGVYAVGSDEVTVSGIDVRVYAVSVRPALPVQVSTSDSLFELVLLEAGTSPQRAAALASRSFYQGTRGRLARFNASVLDKLQGDTNAWVDGRSTTGNAGTFKLADGSFLPGNVWATTTSFTAPRPRGAQAYTMPGQGLRLGHAHPGTSVEAKRAGFWIEYPKAASPSMARSFVAAVSSLFGIDDVEADNEDEAVDEAADDEEVAITSAGEPSCLMAVGLDCLDDG